MPPGCPPPATLLLSSTIQVFAKETLPLLPFDPFVSVTSYPQGSPDPLPEVQLEETCTLPPPPPVPGYAIAVPPP